jgi:hypothetical protein
MENPFGIGDEMGSGPASARVSVPIRVSVGIVTRSFLEPISAIYRRAAGDRDFELTDFGDLFQTWETEYGAMTQIHRAFVSSSFAAALFREQWDVFSAVPINAYSQLPRRFLFPGDLPTPLVLKRFVASAIERLPDIPPDADAAKMWPGLTAQRIVDFLRATSFLKEVRKQREAQEAFKTLIVKSSCPPEFLCGDNVKYDTLREGRVHLDCTANVLYRFFFRTLDLDYCFSISLWTRHHNGKAANSTRLRSIYLIFRSVRFASNGNSSRKSRLRGVCTRHSGSAPHCCGKSSFRLALITGPCDRIAITALGYVRISAPSGGLQTTTTS